MTSITRKSHRYQTLESLTKGSCPVCGDDITIANLHVGGHARYQPFAVCANNDGGYAHVCERITDELAQDYWGFMEWTDTAFGLQQEVQEAS